MSYRSQVPLTLGAATALFAAWVLLSPPLYSQQPEEAAPPEEVPAAPPEEVQPAPEEPAKPGPEPESEPAQPGGAILEVDPAIPADVSPTRLEVDQESGDLVRLPFDHPFTVLLSLGALDLGDREPNLRFLDSRKRLDVLPDNVCDSKQRAAFAGVTTVTSSGGTTRKARFIMPVLDPNRYIVFCFQMTARLSAQLSLPEQKALASALKEALARLETEFETRDFEERRADFRAAFEAALSSFAQREGIGGTIRLERDFSLGDLQTEFHTARQALSRCDLKILQDLKGSFIGGARVLWEDRVPPLANKPSERLDLASCMELYAAGMEEAVRNDNRTVFGTLKRAKDELDGIDRQLGDLAKKAIRALQARDSLFLATSLPATSAARRYVSQDAGFAFVPHLDQSVTYTGINFYLRPVNPPSVTPLGWGWKGLARRTSLTIGFTPTGDLVRKETIGGAEVRIVDDLTELGSPLFGVGFRLNPALRLEAGAVVYKQLETLISQNPKTETSLYFALSLDLDVASLFTDGQNSLFNGGTPTPAAGAGQSPAGSSRP